MSRGVPRRGEEPRAFNQVLVEIEAGRLHDELSRQLQALVATLRDHQAASGAKKSKGRLSLHLDLTLERGIAIIAADIAVKTPKLGRDHSIFWPTEGDNLSPENPRQYALPGVRVVDDAHDVRSA